MTGKPFSQACENNKKPILDVISRYFGPGDRILEVGSGTGQHALYFCEKLPDLSWIPSEIPANLPVIEAGLAGEVPSNLLPVQTLDVRDESWPGDALDGLFSANCLHIMAADLVPDFFRGAAVVLQPGAHLCVYGPFKYDGEFTSESNARFELWLRERDPLSGIRDFEWVDELAQSRGFSLLEDCSMPANNQCLVWRKV